ncbi:MAG: hypothetical protein PCFJNLEI_01963 [Verrucomicrobiae bacterium]|nr:hypothetical protein [Verrucomicrobiae bacterium]
MFIRHLMLQLSRPTIVYLLGLTLFAGGCERFSTAHDTEQEIQRARKAADAGDFRVAATLYGKILRKTPDSARLHLELGLLYDEKLGDPLAALYHYRQNWELETNPARREAVQGYMERVKLTLAAKLPAVNSADPSEMLRLQTEKAALMQENAALRLRLTELERATPPVGEASAIPPTPGPVLTQKVFVTVGAPPPPPAGARTYVVQKSDTLYSIAKQFYGSPAGWEKIYAANRAVLPNKDQLRVGQQLVIP